MNFSPSDFDPIAFQNAPRLRIKPMYFELGFSDRPEMYARRGVWDRIIKALDHLPSEYGFVIWDVYRPRHVQAKLFEWMRGEIRKKYPHLSETERFDLARKYMSPPSRVGEDYCPPHLSGGAIDLTLFDVITENECDMGTPFDDCTERAHSDHFERAGELSADEQTIRDRRRALSSAMTVAGFVPYQYEWWHYDFGNIFWSRITHQPAVFGPLFGDGEWPENKTTGA
ncbi:MAG: D-alanyl-D-alanine dipeptidase [Deltaproteobacteria bacterium]|nr:D-alanyl-D-alanine dipeptidase [Deltaproteobacteria bacterium]